METKCVWKPPCSGKQKDVRSEQGDANNRVAVGRPLDIPPKGGVYSGAEESSPGGWELNFVNSETRQLGATVNEGSQ